MKTRPFILMLILLFTVLISGCVEKPIADETYCGGMSLAEAKQLAIASECGDQLKETSLCNSNTGTWWIDLEIEKEGCNPACVVNVVSKEAVINWRCTGLIPPK